MFFAEIMLQNGERHRMEVLTQEKKGGLIATLPAETLPEKIEEIRFLPEYFTASVGDEGYFVFPGESFAGTLLTHFTPREDDEFSAPYAHMACFGIRKNKKACLGIVTGMQHYFGLRTGVKNGKYYLYPVFPMHGEAVYEDIRIEYYHINNGDYSDMARIYREYQLTRGGCVPLAERIKTNAALQAAAEAPEIRIRQGWKPVPSPIEYQTPENEPPMHVACTFDRAGDIIDAMQKAGLKGGEICLVGWNIGGHDGRFPQIFPADERLGGQEGLDRLIKKAHDAGVNIVCHTSSTAAYKIADCWDEEYLVKLQDGSLLKRPYCWGGGRPHKICPQRQYERFDCSDLPALEKMGFSGIHYIDVMTILPLVSCFDENHPVNHKDTAAWYRKTMDLCRETMGGFASEGAYDFAASSLDYCMYTNFHVLDQNWPKMFDEAIPFWQLVYHGIILYNPCTDTLNYAVKPTTNRLKFFEYGGRPLIVYYANFAKNNNWMGLEDFLCDDQEQLDISIENLKKMYADYEALRDVRYAFMDKHEKITNGVYETTYSNGVRIRVDYNTEKAEIIRNGKVEAL